MRQFGLLLETYSANNDTLNDAVFTIMHHVSGDLNAPEALFVPKILKAFSEIWERVRNYIFFYLIAAKFVTFFIRVKNLSKEKLLYFLV